jgi:hypothetical protein
VAKCWGQCDFRAGAVGRAEGGVVVTPADGLKRTVQDAQSKGRLREDLRLRWPSWLGLALRWSL